VTGIGLIVAAFAAGLVLGTLFFGGLWWTVRRALTATVPAAWFGISALLRMAVVVYGLYCLTPLGLPSLIACVCGLLVARRAVMRLTRTAG
jgi:F1F0 ATPase subunit 2